MRLFAILVGIGAATSAIAHPGGLAAVGCHNDRKNGDRPATDRREDRHLRLIARNERGAATSISLIAQWRVPPALPRFASKIGFGTFFSPLATAAEHPSEHQPLK